MTCTQDLGHDCMYWNQQDLGHELIQYAAGVFTREPGDVPEGYSISRSNTDYFPLPLDSAYHFQICVLLRQQLLHGTA